MKKVNELDTKSTDPVDDGIIESDLPIEEQIALMQDALAALERMRIRHEKRDAERARKNG
jgi:hypothetical protein